MASTPAQRAAPSPLGRVAASPRLRLPASRLRWVALVAGSVIALVALILFAAARLPLSPWTIPLVLEALERANDHPEVTRLLGRPVRLGGLVTGQVRADETGWREFLVRIPVRGPSGAAGLDVRAGRTAAGAWSYTMLELASDAGQRIDVLTPPRLAGLPPAPAVHLVALGPLQSISLDDLARYYRARLGLEIRTLPAAEVTAPLVDHPRDQLVGEVVIEWLRWQLRGVAGEPPAVVIAVSERDLYVRSRSERFALSYVGDHRFAVVSVARLLPEPDTSKLGWVARTVLGGYRLFGKEYLVHKRARRLVGRAIGFLAYRFPGSADPTSLLYRDVTNPASLDTMRDSFETLSQAGALGVPVSHRMPAVEPELIPRTASVKPDGRYPCFVARPLLKPPRAGGTPSASIEACLPGMRTEREYDEVEVDLRSGALIVRTTDLFVPDAIPLVLTRAYRLWDEQPRAFGMGTNHPYDTYPFGSRQPYTFMKLVMADGSTIHFDRISRGTGYADAVYEHVETATPFLRSRVRWNGGGWDLQFPDGSLFVFPEAYAAKRGAEGALIEMRDGAGRAVKLNRDRRRNLLEAVAPGGGSITFEYDSGDRVTRAADHRGRVVRYAYDVAGRLARVTDPEGGMVQHVYDATKLLAIENAGGAPVLRVRYVHDRVSTLWLPDGRAYGFRFIFGPSDEDEHATVAIVRDPDGRVTEVDTRTGARHAVATGR